MKRVLQVLLLTACLCTLFQIPCKAQDNSGTYMDLMSSSYAYMYTRAQPNDALVLDSAVTVNNRSLTCTNVRGVSINLPRLKHSYYYTLPIESSAYALVTSPYPGLALYNPTYQDPIKLRINSSDTGDVLKEIVIVVQGELSSTAQTTRVDLDFASVVPDDMVSIDTATTYYNPELQDLGLVTDNHMYLMPDASNKSMWLNAELTLERGSLTATDEDGIVDMTQYDGTIPVHRITYPYSYLSKEFSVDLESTFSSVLTTNTDIVTWFTDSSVTRTRANIYSQPALADTGGSYWIAVDDMLVIAEAPHKSRLTDDKLKEKQQNITNQKYVAPGTSVDLTTNSDYHMLFQDIDKQDTCGMDSNIVVLNGAGANNTYNGFGFYGGVVPAAVSVYANSTYVLHFDTGDEDMTCVVGIEPTLPTPTKAYFTFGGWFVDEDYKTPFDYTKHGVADAQVNLYAKWDYSGGYYTVRFVDLYNNTSESQRVRVIDQPVLPENPKRAGFLFSHWVIVQSLGDEGTKYSPDTFVPAADYTYTFVAYYAVHGAIVKIENSKTEYFVGQSLDTTALKITVQTDDTGTTKVLSANEYTVSPTKFTEVGTKTLTITYLETGATATTTVTVKKDEMTKIDASYSGGSLKVGSTITTSSISVKATYASGTTSVLTSFTINPTTVRDVGVNKITVSYGALTSTIEVTGVAASTSGGGGSSGTTGAKLKSISAVYNGSDVYVGTTLLSSNFTVTATYSDGSSEILSNAKFSFTPSYLSKAGTNAIVISYGGLSTVVTINVKESPASQTVAATTNNTAQAVTTDGSTSAAESGTSGTGAPDTTSDKTTSVGYLNGANILTMLMNSIPTTAFNSIVISDIISDASDSASLPMTVLNLAEDSVLTDADMELIYKKKLNLVINIKDTETDTIIGCWEIDGQTLTSLKGFNLSIYVSEVPKASETMYAIYVDDVTYDPGVSCRVYLPEAYPRGEYVSVYQCSSQLDDSNCLAKYLWETDELSLPLESAPNYVLTNSRLNYANGSDLTQELTNDTVEEETETEPESEFESEELWDVDMTDVTEDSEVTSNKPKVKLGRILLLIGGIWVAIGIGLAAILILKKKRQTSVEFEESNENGDFDEDW